MYFDCWWLQSVYCGGHPESVTIVFISIADLFHWSLTIVAAVNVSDNRVCPIDCVTILCRQYNELRHDIVLHYPLSWVSVEQCSTLLLHVYIVYHVDSASLLHDRLMNNAWWEYRMQSSFVVPYYIPIIMLYVPQSCHYNNISENPVVENPLV